MACFLPAILVQKINRYVLPVVLVACATMAPATSQAADPNPALVLPQNSFAYIHVQVDTWRDIPAFALLKQFADHIASESSLASTAHLGVDLTALEDVTFVLPSFDQLMAAEWGRDTPWCLIATFSKSFRAADITKVLPSTWTPSEVAQRYFVNGSDGLHIASNTSVVIGNTAGVEWWLNTPKDEAEGTLTELLNNSLEAGHVLFGVDLNQVPDEAFASLPPSTQWLANTTFASLDVLVSDEVTFTTYLSFADAEAAAAAQQQFTKLVAEATSTLTALEAETKPVVQDANSSPEKVIEALLKLSALRQGTEMLEQIEVGTDEQTVVLQAAVDDSLLGYVLGTAIVVPQIGRHAGSEFQDVSATLE